MCVQHRYIRGVDNLPKSARFFRTHIRHRTPVDLREKVVFIQSPLIRVIHFEAERGQQPEEKKRNFFLAAVTMPAVPISLAASKQLPPDALRIDVRRLPNPWKKCLNLDDPVSIIAWIFRHSPNGRTRFLNYVQRGIRLMFPDFPQANDEKTLYVICHGGKHRSVAVAHWLNNGTRIQVLEGNAYVLISWQDKQDADEDK